MQTTTGPETVVLRGGVVASLDALRLLWRLEDAGYRIRVEGDDLVATPGSRLNTQERTAIREHKPALMALIRYVDEVVA